MTTEQKKRVNELRSQGLGYKKIAQILMISPNTVKTYCRRNVIVSPEPSSGSTCLYCGDPVIQNPGRKQKRFCSDRCRNKWWNEHLDRVKRKAFYDFVCPVCKKPFTAYGNAKRKYCSHECYVEDRFGGRE